MTHRLPRYHVGDANGLEWQVLDRKMNTTHQHKIIFVTNWIRTGEIHIIYEPMAEIRGDFYTELLQGAAFKKSRNLILDIVD